MNNMLLLPRKEARSAQLTVEDKDFDRSIFSERAAVENINQSLVNMLFHNMFREGPMMIQTKSLQLHMLFLLYVIFNCLNILFVVVDRDVSSVVSDRLFE